MKRAHTHGLHMNKIMCNSGENFTWSEIYVKQFVVYKIYSIDANLRPMKSTVDLICKRWRACSLSLPRNTKQGLNLPVFFTKQDQVHTNHCNLSWGPVILGTSSLLGMTDRSLAFESKRKVLRVTRQNNWWFATCG